MAKTKKNATGLSILSVGHKATQEHIAILSVLNKNDGTLGQIGRWVQNGCTGFISHQISTTKFDKKFFDDSILIPLTSSKKISSIISSYYDEINSLILRFIKKTEVLILLYDPTDSFSAQMVSIIYTHYKVNSPITPIILVGLPRITRTSDSLDAVFGTWGIEHIRTAFRNYYTPDIHMIFERDLLHKSWKEKGIMKKSNANKYISRGYVMSRVIETLILGLSSKKDGGSESNLKLNEGKMKYFQGLSVPFIIDPFHPNLSPRTILSNTLKKSIQKTKEIEGLANKNDPYLSAELELLCEDEGDDDEEIEINSLDFNDVIDMKPNHFGLLAALAPEPIRISSILILSSTQNDDVYKKQIDNISKEFQKNNMMFYAEEYSGDIEGNKYIIHEEFCLDAPENRLLVCFNGARPAFMHAGILTMARYINRYSRNGVFKEAIKTIEKRFGYPASFHNIWNDAELYMGLSHVTKAREDAIQRERISQQTNTMHQVDQFDFLTKKLILREFVNTAQMDNIIQKDEEEFLNVIRKMLGLEKKVQENIIAELKASRFLIASQVVPGNWAKELWDVIMSDKEISPQELALMGTFTRIFGIDFFDEFMSDESIYDFFSEAPAHKKDKKAKKVARVKKRVKK